MGLPDTGNNIFMVDLHELTLALGFAWRPFVFGVTCICCPLYRSAITKRSLRPAVHCRGTGIFLIGIQTQRHIAVIADYGFSFLRNSFLGCLTVNAGDMGGD